MSTPVVANNSEGLGYLRVILFALSAFIFNTAEFIPVALLSDIAQTYDMSVSHTGLMITAYAWIVSLTSLPFMLMTAKFERKGLMLKVFTAFIIGHIITIFAPNFAVLVAGRIVIAFAHAIFWAISASLVVRVAPPNKANQALALFALGTALAMVLGLSLGRIIGQFVGWRMTFAIIAIVAGVIMTLLALFLPRLSSQNVGSLDSLPLLAKRPLLIGLYILTAVMISAHFTAYSYIEPFTLTISKLTEDAATYALLIFGVSGIFASYLFSRLYSYAPNIFVLALLGIMLASLVLLLPISHNHTALFGLIFIWGIGIAALGLSFQLRVLQLAPDATDVAMSIYSGIYNIGIGAGALIRDSRKS
ncbi:sugar transporter, partial [Psittacicella hinzii]